MRWSRRPVRSRHTFWEVHLISSETRCFAEQIWRNVGVWEAHIDHTSQGITSVLGKYPFINRGTLNFDETMSRLALHVLSTHTRDASVSRKRFLSVSERFGWCCCCGEAVGCCPRLRSQWHSSVGEEFKCNLNLIWLGLNQKPIKLTTVVLFSIPYLLWSRYNTELMNGRYWHVIYLSFLVKNMHLPVIHSYFLSVYLTFWR